MQNLHSIIIFLLAVICIHLVESQDCSMHKVLITCEYVAVTAFYDDNEEINYCRAADSINSINNVNFPGSSVSTFLHSNGSEVTNRTEIEGLFVQYATFKFIPTDIAMKLPNLRVLAIRSSKLVSLSKENMKQFGEKLELADFSENKIISIDADLFEYNPNLAVIFLESNPIRYIHPEFFTNLKNLNLKMFLFNSAGCIDQDFNTEREEKGLDFASFEWNYDNCTEFSATFETKDRIKASLCEEAKTSYLTTKITENNDKNTEMLAFKLESIAESINALNARISVLEEFIRKQPQ